ncbi:MAG: DUF1592 domain-containing protein [Sandaracinaceae bacterium]
MGSPRARRRLAGPTILALVCGCAASPAPPTSAADVADDEGALCAAGPSTLRRLTREEYDATVRDLFGDDTAPASRFPPDENNLGYAVGAAVSPLHVELYRDAAEGVAARAVEHLDGLTASCPARDEACARSVVRRLGRRAYRAAPPAASEARLLSAWRAGEAEGGFDEGLRVAIAALLQSPRFLYLVEGEAGDGPGDGPVPLTGPERAARLSYFLWGTTPDEALLTAAEGGELASVDGVERWARRMLEDPRARESMDRFATQWLELGVADADKDPAVFPEWSPALGRAMDRSIRRFFEHVVFDSEGTLSELLTSREAFVDATLAPVYGVEAPAAMARVTLPAGERAGLLTQAAILAQRALPNDGSPVRRGKLVRERFFCHELPPPPDGLATVPPAPEPGTTTRERYRRHSEDPVCVSCHELMDPLGFTFERYDGIGRYRAADHGVPLDARAVIVATRHTDGEVDGAVELAARLAASPDVEECFVRQMWRFALRRLESDEDACALARVDRRFAEAGGDVRALLIAIATSEPFLYRARSAGGEAEP